MPNYVANRIHIDADAERMQNILSAIRRDGDVLGSFDFNKLIPMPESLNLEDGSITTDSIHAFISDAYAKEKDISHYAEAVVEIHRHYFTLPGRMILTPEELDELSERYEMSVDDLVALGKQYLDNQVQYGAPTWYNWRVKNWGTKWGALEGSVLHGENELHFDSAWSAPLRIVNALSQKFPSIRFDHEWADEDTGYNVGRCSFLAGEVIDRFIPEAGSKEAIDMANEIWGRDPEMEIDSECIPLDQQISAAENSRNEQRAASGHNKVSTQDREEVR